MSGAVVTNPGMARPVAPAARNSSPAPCGFARGPGLCGAAFRGKTAVTQRSTAVLAAAKPEVANIPNLPEGVEVPTKRMANIRSVDVVDLGDRTFVLNGTCDERFRVAVEYGLNRGTSNNSYVLRGGSVKSNVLIDIPDEAYVKEWLKQLYTVVPPHEVGTLVLTHLAPGSVDTIVRFLEVAMGPARNQYETLTIVLSNPALVAMRSRLGESKKGMSLLSRVILVTARPNVPLQLGDGSELSFIRTPTPRWPDAMCVYEAKTGSLFTSKLFSCHRAPEVGTVPVLDEKAIEEYAGDFRYYFQCMLAPVASQAAIVLSKLDLRASEAQTESVFKGLMATLKTKLKGALVGTAPAEEEELGEEKAGGAKPLIVKRLCPRHGPILTGGAPQLLNLYKQWIDATIEAASRANVAVMYASAYGHTASLAQAISRGITKGGVGVQTLNLETVGLEQMQAALDACDGFILGSPTLGGHLPTQVTAALGTIVRDQHARTLPCSVFGSFGWSGEAVDEMEQKLKDSGFGFAFEPIRCKFRADEAVLQLCEESGLTLAQDILIKQRKLKKEAERRALAGSVETAAGSATQRALDRVVGALGVVTCKDGDKDYATVVSSISQASFNPPGVTLAVERNAKTEPLLILNSTFNINLMTDGKEEKYATALKKGSDLDEFESEPSEETGCARLADAASCLECKVIDRMEAGDRWIIYAEVEAGVVLEESALGAIYLPCVR